MPDDGVPWLLSIETGESELCRGGTMRRPACAADLWVRE